MKSPSGKCPVSEVVSLGKCLDSGIVCLGNVRRGKCLRGSVRRWEYPLGNCLSGEVSVGGNLRWEIVCRRKCPSGEISVGKLSVGGNTCWGKCVLESLHAVNCQLSTVKVDDY